MKPVSKEAVREFLVNHFSQAIANRGVTPETVGDSFDLLQEGIVDSLGIIEMISEIEKHFEVTVDFEGLPAEEFTVVGPFCHYVAAQTNGEH